MCAKKGHKKKRRQKGAKWGLGQGFWEKDGRMHLPQAAERRVGEITIQKRGWDWDSATYHTDAPPWEVVGGNP